MSLEVSDDRMIYTGVRVSSLDWDFRAEHDTVPRRLLRDWSRLLLTVARIFDSDFPLLQLPDEFEFAESTIHSDGPYGSSEDFYTLSEFWYARTAKDGRGLRVSFEKGRQGGEDGIMLETLDALIPISSTIPRESAKPLASLYIVVILREVSQAQIDAAEAAIRRHHRACGG